MKKNYRFNFTWSMTEDDWKRLKDVQLNHTETNDDCFGAVECGAVRLEFVHRMEPTEWCFDTNTFLYGCDSDYGVLENGVTYELCDWDVIGNSYSNEDWNSISEYADWFLGETFEQFKGRVENEIEFAVCCDEDRELQEYTQKPFGDWR